MPLNSHTVTTLILTLYLAEQSHTSTKISYITHFSLLTNTFCVIILCYLVLGSHLVVEEHVDDRVDDSAELGQDGGYHTSHGSDQSRPAEGGHQCHNTVGHPAQHVAGHHGQHHHQNVLLPALGCQQIDLTHL